MLEYKQKQETSQTTPTDKIYQNRKTIEQEFNLISAADKKNQTNISNTKETKSRVP
jgi:hypothetical protein